VLRVRLGQGPLDTQHPARGPRGPRRPREVVPSAQELLVFGARGVRRLEPPRGSAAARRSGSAASA
jgi:hypothetical protein